MEITEVKVKLIESRSNRLQAFCSITIDNNFVVRDLKIIEGSKGAFVAMPSRKIMDRCSHCGAKNHLRAKFCNECGKALGSQRIRKNGKIKLHADIAHPINSQCREIIQKKVLEAYEEEKIRYSKEGQNYVATEIYHNNEDPEGDDFNSGL